MPLPEGDEEAKRDQRKRDLFFTEGSEHGRDNKPTVALRIKRPEGQQQQRGGQGHGMKIIEGFAQDFRRGEVGPHEGGSHERVFWKATQRKPQQRNASECQRHRLQQQQRLRAAMEQVQRSDQRAQVHRAVGNLEILQRAADVPRIDVEEHARLMARDDQGAVGVDHDPRHGRFFEG